MSDYLEGLNTVLKIIDTATEPSYRSKLRMQKRSQKEMARYNKDLQLEANNLKYERELLSDQLNMIEGDISGMQDQQTNLQASYNSATGEWVKMDDVYKSAGGTGNYDKIFNDTTPYATLDDAIERANSKKQALTLINDNLTNRINNIGNFSSFQTKALDYDRYTATGEGIIDPQDIEGSYAESLIKMGYDPRNAPELFPSLNMQVGNNLEQYISSPSYDMSKLQDLKTDIPDYLREYISINHPSNSQIRELQREYNKQISDDLTNQVNILDQKQTIEGYLNPTDEQELEELKTQHTSQMSLLQKDPGVLQASDIGNDAWNDYVNYVGSQDYSLMNDYFGMINELTDGIPGANWQDFTKAAQPYNQPVIDIDGSQNPYVKVNAGSDNDPARSFYGFGMTSEEWDSTLNNEIQNGMLSDDLATSLISRWMGINKGVDGKDISNYKWYWATSDNVKAEQWRQDNPYQGREDDIQALIEYKKKSILETTGDINSNFADPTFNTNMMQAQNALNTKWGLYFDFVNQNPLPKLVGYDTWVQANDMFTVDPSRLVLDVVQPWMEVVNAYSQLRGNLTSRGIEQQSDEWNTEMNAFLSNATMEYGGAVSVYADRFLSDSHPSKEYYDSTVNPGFSINEEDILKVVDEILPIFLNDADETVDNYDQLRLAQQISDRFDKISKLEGGASTYVPKGPSQNALNLIEKMKQEGFTGTPFSNINTSNTPSLTNLSNLGSIPNISFSQTTNPIVTNTMSIEAGAPIVDNRKQDILSMDWDSYMNTGDFDNGFSYINNLRKLAENNGSTIAVPLHSVRSSYGFVTLAESYNNDGDKLLYHPATGPNPVMHYRDLNDETYLEDLQTYGGNQFRISEAGSNNSDELLKDLLTVNLSRTDLIRASDQYGKGYIPNISYYHGLIAGPNFAEIENNGPDETNWVGLADDAIVDEELMFDNDYINAYANYSEDAINRFNNHIVNNIFNVNDIDDVNGNFLISKPSSSYDPYLGRYYLNFPVNGRPNMMTEEKFSAMNYDDRKQYLEDQYTWNTEQGVLGDQGFGMITKNDMFLPDQTKRTWLTPQEALDPSIRERYEDNAASNLVYLKDPKGGRGHFVDLEVFYQFHLEAATNNDMPLDDVMYDENGAILAGYYDLEGYAGPMQNLINSNDVFSFEDIANMGGSSAANMHRHITDINSLKEEPIEIGDISEFSQRIQNEIEEELLYLGINPDDFLSSGISYQPDPQELIDSLNILRDR